MPRYTDMLLAEKTAILVMRAQPELWGPELWGVPAEAEAEAPKRLRSNAEEASSGDGGGKKEPNVKQAKLSLQPTLTAGQQDDPIVLSDG